MQNLPITSVEINFTKITKSKCHNKQNPIPPTSPLNNYCAIINPFTFNGHGHLMMLFLMAAPKVLSGVRGTPHQHRWLKVFPGLGEPPIWFLKKIPAPHRAFFPLWRDLAQRYENWGGGEKRLLADPPTLPPWGGPRLELAPGVEPRPTTKIAEIPEKSPIMQKSIF